VIVPVYNRRGFLERCLASIEATRYPNLEVVMVDDGSSDGSWELIRQLGRDRGETVRALHHPQHRNRGISASRNLGIAQASGTYLAFLDSDDEYLPGRFNHCVGMLESHPSLHAVYEPVLIEPDGPGEPRSVPSAASINHSGHDPLDWLLCREWWHTSGVTLRRQFLTDYGGFRLDLPVAEDTELWMRVTATGAIRCCQQDNPVATVHRHREGHSWDAYQPRQNARFYRKALLTTLHSIEKEPQRYHQRAREVFRSRYLQTVEADISFLSQPQATLALAQLFVEATLQQPGALWNKRTLGNLLRWRRWR
jgi:glycosyltransferase involved in cell wall biosynthesis